MTVRPLPNNVRLYDAPSHAAPIAVPWPAENAVSVAYLITAAAAIGAGALMGVLQALTRAQLITPPVEFDYYRILTAHGVLMALVFTTFSIYAILHFTLQRTLQRPFFSLKLAWAGFAVTLIGTLMTAFYIVVGEATVLYTFYAPLKAAPGFYLGATLLVVGTWISAAQLFLTYGAWRREHPGERMPLIAHGVIATNILWIIATLGVAVEVLVFLLPWSVGLTEGVDVVITRALFWFFGHPLVYFWIMPAYLIWYTIIPAFAGGKILSDSLTRTAFVALLLFSTPVGFHHQFLEPGIPEEWKLVHTVTTFAVLTPSLMSAFALTASLEIAGRARGGTGLFGWIRTLPWGDPVFLAPVLALLTFVPGGIGGIINASPNLNMVVHNTSWIVGHFHLTVGSAAALTFMGAFYWMLPRLTGRALWGRRFALAASILWVVGMLFMSTAQHAAGLLGSPRRTSDVSYGGSEVAAAWMPHQMFAAVGGSILFIAVACFLLVVINSLIAERRQAIDQLELPESQLAPGGGPSPRILDNFKLWTGLAFILIIVAYAIPLAQMVMHSMPVPGYRLW